MTPEGLVKRWRDDPVFFVTDELKAEPDAWQVDVLRLLPDPAVKRIAMKACVGPGKSATMAWIGWYFLATQGDEGQHPKGAAVSITAELAPPPKFNQSPKSPGRLEIT